MSAQQPNNDTNTTQAANDPSYLSYLMSLAGMSSTTSDDDTNQQHVKSLPIITSQNDSTNFQNRFNSTNPTTIDNSTSLNSSQVGLLNDSAILSIMNAIEQLEDDIQQNDTKGNQTPTTINTTTTTATTTDDNGAPTSLQSQQQQQQQQQQPINNSLLEQPSITPVTSLASTVIASNQSDATITNNDESDQNNEYKSTTILPSSALSANSSGGRNQQVVGSDLIDPHHIDNINSTDLVLTTCLSSVLSDGVWEMISMGSQNSNESLNLNLDNNASTTPNAHNDTTVDENNQITIENGDKLGHKLDDSREGDNADVKLYGSLLLASQFYGNGSFSTIFGFNDNNDKIKCDDRTSHLGLNQSNNSQNGDLNDQNQETDQSNEQIAENCPQAATFDLLDFSTGSFIINPSTISTDFAEDVVISSQNQCVEHKAVVSEDKVGDKVIDSHKDDNRVIYPGLPDEVDITTPTTTTTQQPVETTTTGDENDVIIPTKAAICPPLYPGLPDEAPITGNNVDNDEKVADSGQELEKQPFVPNLSDFSNSSSDFEVMTDEQYLELMEEMVILDEAEAFLKQLAQNKQNQTNVEIKVVEPVVVLDGAMLAPVDQNEQDGAVAVEIDENAQLDEKVEQIVDKCNDNNNNTMTVSFLIKRPTKTYGYPGLPDEVDVPFDHVQTANTAQSCENLQTIDVVPTFKGYPTLPDEHLPTTDATPIPHPTNNTNTNVTLKNNFFISGGKVDYPMLPDEITPVFTTYTNVIVKMVKSDENPPLYPGLPDEGDNNHILPNQIAQQPSVTTTTTTTDANNEQVDNGVENVENVTKNDSFDGEEITLPKDISNIEEYDIIQNNTVVVANPVVDPLSTLTTTTAITTIGVENVVKTDENIANVVKTDEKVESAAADRPQSSNNSSDSGFIPDLDEIEAMMAELERDQQELQQLLTQHGVKIDEKIKNGENVVKSVKTADKLTASGVSDVVPESISPIANHVVEINPTVEINSTVEKSNVDIANVVEPLSPGMQITPIVPIPTTIPTTSVDSFLFSPSPYNYNNLSENWTEILQDMVKSTEIKQNPPQTTTTIDNNIVQQGQNDEKLSPTHTDVEKTTSQLLDSLASDLDKVDSLGTKNANTTAINHTGQKNNEQSSSSTTNSNMVSQLLDNSFFFSTGNLSALLTPSPVHYRLHQHNQQPPPLDTSYHLLFEAIQQDDTYELSLFLETIDPLVMNHIYDPWQNNLTMLQFAIVTNSLGSIDILFDNIFIDIFTLSQYSNETALSLGLKYGRTDIVNKMMKREVKNGYTQQLTTKSTRSQQIQTLKRQQQQLQKPQQPTQQSLVIDTTLHPQQQQSMYPINPFYKTDFYPFLHQQKPHLIQPAINNVQFTPWLVDIYGNDLFLNANMLPDQPPSLSTIQLLWAYLQTLGENVDLKKLPSNPHRQPQQSATNSTTNGQHGSHMILPINFEWKNRQMNNFLSSLLIRPDYNKQPTLLAIYNKWISGYYYSPDGQTVNGQQMFIQHIKHAQKIPKSVQETLENANAVVIDILHFVLQKLPTQFDKELFFSSLYPRFYNKAAVSQGSSSNAALDSFVSAGQNQNGLKLNGLTSISSTVSSSDPFAMPQTNVALNASVSSLSAQNQVNNQELVTYTIFMLLVETNQFQLLMRVLYAFRSVIPQNILLYVNERGESFFSMLQGKLAAAKRRLASNNYITSFITAIPSQQAPPTTTTTTTMNPNSMADFTSTQHFSFFLQPPTQQVSPQSGLSQSQMMSFLDIDFTSIDHDESYAVVDRANQAFIEKTLTLYHNAVGTDLSVSTIINNCLNSTSHPQVPSFDLIKRQLVQQLRVYYRYDNIMCSLLDRYSTMLSSPSMIQGLNKQSITHKDAIVDLMFDTYYAIDPTIITMSTHSMIPTCPVITRPIEPTAAVKDESIQNAVKDEQSVNKPVIFDRNKLLKSPSAPQHITNPAPNGHETYFDTQTSQAFLDSTTLTTHSTGQFSVAQTTPAAIPSPQQINNISTSTSSNPKAASKPTQPSSRQRVFKAFDPFDDMVDAMWPEQEQLSSSTTSQATEVALAVPQGAQQHNGLFPHSLSHENLQNLDGITLQGVFTDLMRALGAAPVNHSYITTIPSTVSPQTTNPPSKPTTAQPTTIHDVKPSPTSPKVPQHIKNTKDLVKYLKDQRFNAYPKEKQDKIVKVQNKITNLEFKIEELHAVCEQLAKSTGSVPDTMAEYLTTLTNKKFKYHCILQALYQVNPYDCNNTTTTGNAAAPTTKNNADDKAAKQNGVDNINNNCKNVNNPYDLGVSCNITVHTNDLTRSNQQLVAMLKQTDVEKNNHTDVDLITNPLELATSNQQQDMIDVVDFDDLPRDEDYSIVDFDATL